MITSVIGIDCAAQAERMGVAFGSAPVEGIPTVHRVATGLGWSDLAAEVVRQVSGSARCLLALDAPLGWPDPLRQELSRHRAGHALPGHADHLFLRETDRTVWSILGKRPLEVGADRIARAARSALQLVDEIRRTTGRPIPLAWEARYVEPVAAIEVYPAATLRGHGLAVPSYKGPKAEHRRARAGLVGALTAVMSVEVPPHALIESPDLLDAALCVLAGCDFVQDTCHPPSDPPTAEREGWIWFRATQTSPEVQPRGGTPAPRG